MKSRKIHQTRDELVSAEDTQVETTVSLDLSLVEMLGFTNFFLSQASDEYASFLNSDKLSIATLASEIGLLKAKINVLETKLAPLKLAANVKSAREREREWREILAKERAQKLETEIQKARDKQGKSLTGIDKRLYKETGKLPQEYKKAIMDEFAKFLASQK